MKMIAVHDIEALKRHFENRRDVAFAFLFGSHARGTATKLSDRKIIGSNLQNSFIKNAETTDNRVLEINTKRLCPSQAPEPLGDMSCNRKDGVDE